MIKTFCFLLLKADRQAHPWIFFTVHSHELITVKILEFYPAHLCLVVTNGLINRHSCFTLTEVLQELIYSFKKKKQKRNDSFLQQRRNKEICKLPYLEDFEANVEVAEDKILCQLNYTR